MPKPSQTLGWNPPEGSTTVVEPSLAKKLLGWLRKEKPPHQIFNWFWKRTSQWVDYLNVYDEETHSWKLQQTFGDGLIGSFANAVIARLIARTASSAVAKRTLVLRTDPQALLGSFFSPIRIWAVADPNATCLEVTLNADYVPSSASAGTWAKDISGRAALYFRLIVPASSGMLTLARKESSVNTAWADDFTSSGWSGGYLALNPQLDSAQHATVPRVQWGVYPGGLLLKTQLFMFGVAGMRVRLFATDAPSLEISLNADWSNTQAEWSKDTAGELAGVARFRPDTFELAGKLASNDDAWDDDIEDDVTDHWDVAIAAFRSGSGVLGLAKLFRGIRLGDALLTEALAIVERLDIAAWAGAGAATDKTLIGKVAAGVTAARAYFSPNGQVDITLNARWSNATDKWSKDNNALAAWLLRLSLDDASGDYFIIATKLSSEDTAWNDGVGSSTQWSRWAWSTKRSTKAWAYLETSGSGLTTHDAIGCSVTRNTVAKEITITLAHAMANANYAVVISAYGKGVGNDFPLGYAIIAKTTTAFTFNLYLPWDSTPEPTDIATDPLHVTVTVRGQVAA